MSEKDFTNREIVLMFNEIKLELGYIKEQTTKHNGRMTKAEDKIDKLGGFKVKVMTIWTIAVAGVTFVINKYL